MVYLYVNSHMQESKKVIEQIRKLLKFAMIVILIFCSTLKVTSTSTYTHSILIDPMVGSGHVTQLEGHSFGIREMGSDVSFP